MACFVQMQELLSQVGHYSERTRLAAMAGLADLLARHPQQATKNTGPLLEALVPRISDADPSVRKALLQLLNAQVTSVTSLLCTAALDCSRAAPGLPLLRRSVHAAAGAAGHWVQGAAPLPAAGHGAHQQRDDIFVGLCEVGPGSRCKSFANHLNKQDGPGMKPWMAGLAQTTMTLVADKRAQR